MLESAGFHAVRCRTLLTQASEFAGIHLTTPMHTQLQVRELAYRIV